MESPETKTIVNDRAEGVRAITLSPGAAAFRELLARELAARIQRNSRYSLRSFARALGIHAPTLSHLLRGKRTLSKKTIKKLSVPLGVSPADLTRYLED